MMGLTANNVVSLVKGANPAKAKDLRAHSNSDHPDRGSSNAEVTVLLPRMKKSSIGLVQGHKSAVDGKSDSKDQGEADDLAAGQDLFGSLVANVGQKLTQQDGRLPQPDNVRSADAGPDGSFNRVSQLLLHGVFSDSGQHVGLKTSREVKRPDTSPSVELHSLPGASDSQSNPEVDFVGAENFADLGQAKPGFTVKSSNFGQPALSHADESQPASNGDNSEANERAGLVSEKAAKSASSDKPGPGTPKETMQQRTAAGQVTSTPDATAVTALNGMDGKFLSPAAQIVENIKNAAPAEPIAPPTGSVIPQPAKTLEIQLQPEGLGLVTVSLKSDEGKLKVQISAKLDTTRQELESNSAELVSGLRTVGPTFTDVDVNFSEQNQGAAPDTSGQAFGNSGDRRGTPENTASFGSNGGQDADQASADRQNAVYGKVRPGPKVVAGELPSRRDRADGIYI